MVSPSYLQIMFWLCEALVIFLLLAPITRFLRKGWFVRKQEFTNRLCGKQIQIYLDRFWGATVAHQSKDTDKQFSYVYDRLAGRALYITPTIILCGTMMVFGGFAIQSGLRVGYELYRAFYSGHQAPLAPMDLHAFDQALRPFPLLLFDVPTIAAVGGAYLYTAQVIISGYQSRTLLSSDLLWCAFRLIIAIPLGMCIGLPGIGVGLPLVGFALGAFPIGTINRLLRRLAGRGLNDAELQGNKDDLLKITGVTPEVSAILQQNGISAPQQLAAVDPVSLALRTGLPFDTILSFAAQGQVWSFIGATTESLTGMGFGDARAIAKLMAHDPGDQMRVDCLAILAVKSGLDLPILMFNFEAVAADSYTMFLAEISGLDMVQVQIQRQAASAAA